MAAILIGLPQLPAINLDETEEVLWGEGIRLWRRLDPPSSENETSDSVPESFRFRVSTK
jgi:hypothetical protein